MKKIFVVVFVFSAIFIYSEVLKISTPAGSFKMSVQSDDSTTKHSQNVSVVDKIADDLDLLSSKYIGKLNKLDQKRAKKVIDEIYDLLALLPEDVYYTHNNGKIQTTNQTQSQNVNITIKTDVQNATPQTKEMQKETPKVNAMSESAFNTLYNNVSNEGFADDKLSQIKVAAKRNTFKVSQVVRLLGLFSFADDKIKCLEILYPKVVDKENSHNILNAFTFSEDKKKVEKIINR